MKSKCRRWALVSTSGTVSTVVEVGVEVRDLEADHREKAGMYAGEAPASVEDVLAERHGGLDRHVTDSGDASGDGRGVQPRALDCTATIDAPNFRSTTGSTAARIDGK
jgi:hypothetical protein